MTTSLQLWGSQRCVASLTYSARIALRTEDRRKSSGDVRWRPNARASAVGHASAATYTIHHRSLSPLRNCTTGLGCPAKAGQLPLIQVLLPHLRGC